MVKPKLFSIVLSNPQLIFSPRQMVEGYVNLELDEEISTKGVKVRFVGAAKVSWTEGGGQNTRYYGNSESYIDAQKFVFGKEQTGKEEVELKPGTYKYPFAFQVPPGCPSSFETKKGNVRYFVEAIIVRPWKFDIKKSCALTVQSPLDLNMIQDSQSAVNQEGSDTTCCLCCKGGPVRVVLKLQKKGYVPGETIYVNAEVDNGGRRKFKALFAELVMLAKCVGKGLGTKIGVDELIINKVTHGPLSSGGSDYFNNEAITVPVLPASQLVGCSIIDIQYLVRIKATVSGVGFAMTVPTEVIIGTKSPTQPEASFSHMQPSFPAAPSYNEYTFSSTMANGESSNKDKDGELKGFAPKYASHDRNQSHGLFK